MTTHMIKLVNVRNSIFEDFEPEEGNYLFTVKTPHEEVIHKQFLHDVEMFITKGSAGGAKIEMQGIGSVFSSLMTYMQSFLYNNEEINKAYPNGFVTNDKIFLPVSLVGDLLNKNKNTPIPNMFINAITSLIENKYNVEIDNSKLINKDDMQYKYIFDNANMPKVPYVNAPELQQLLRSSGIYEQSIAKIIEKSSTNYIDKVLAQSYEINNPEHAFSTLKSQVENNINNMPSLPRQSTGFALENYWDNMNSDNINTLLTLLQKDISDIVKTAPDFDSAMQKVDEEWLNIASEVSNNNISDVFKMYVETIEQAHPSLGQNSPKEFIEKAVIALVQSPGVDDIKRSILIKAASGLNLNSGMKKLNYKIVEKESYDLELEYFDACQSGDLEKVKALLKNDKLDILNEDMKGFNIACENNHSDIAVYLLTSPELKNNIPLNAISLGTIGENRLSNVLESIIKQPQLKDQLTEESIYYASMACAGRTGSIEAVKELRKYDVADKDLKTANALEYASTQGHLPLVKMLLTDVFKKPSLISKFKDKINGNYELDNIHDAIQICFFKAVEEKQEEIVLYYLYDYDLKLTGKYKEKAEQDNNLLRIIGLRELNKKLQNDLPIHGGNKKPKAKIKI